MLMRVSGGAEGIREYLETGRKADRAFSRDELDTRVPIAGDLDFTDRVIAGIEGDGEKYLHITLSLREDEVSPETLAAMVEDFRAFAFSAYDSDEYALYAEAHLPRQRSYVNAKTGELVERKPHIHIVIPETNLLTGQRLNPFGKVEQQTAFLEAFQEHVNAKYGLASPKDHRRTELTPASELISRYKGDTFKGPGGDLKAELLDAMLTRDVRSVEAFDALLAERGQVRVRNAGKAGEYRNVKPGDADKGVNLKDYVFSREFIELPAAEKQARLTREAATHYETAKAARPTAEEYAGRLDDWHGRRSREIKYLNSGNRKAYRAYREATPEQQRAMLADREAAFYRRHRGALAEATAALDRPSPAQAAAMRRAYREALEERPEVRSSLAAVPTLAALPTLGSIKTLAMGNAAEAEPAASPTPAVELPAAEKQPNSVTAHLAAEVQEKRQAQAGQARGEFDTIKRELDALALLAHVSHTHGVIPEKYQVTKGKDGGDRIQCGTRQLNVTDFLTKELNLPWREAAPILRACHAQQEGQEPPVAKERPRAALWREYREQWAPAHFEAKAKAWEAQKAQEKARWAAVRIEYLAKRGKAYGDRSLKPADRKAAVSVARMDRIATELGLRETKERERKALRDRYQLTPADRYREFLRELAEAGRADALAELRRQTGPSEAKAGTHDATLASSAAAVDTRPLPFRYAVDHRGNVTYSDQRGELLRDEAKTIAVLRRDNQAIEVSLRLAEQKFYDPKTKESLLVASGSDEFKQRLVEVAAQRGMGVRFDDPAMEARRRELVAELDKRRASQKGQTRAQPDPQRPRDTTRKPGKDGDKGRG